MSDVSAAASQVAQVQQTLRETGGVFPEHVINPQLSRSDWQPSISPILRDTIAREAAGEPADHSGLQKHLGLDPKAVMEAAGKLLKDAGIEADVARLSATTLASLWAVHERMGSK